MGYPPENPQDSCVSLTHPPRETTLPPRMQHRTRPGRIEVIAGVMFSGKSEELIRRVRRAVIAKNQVQVFKSHLDARYAGLYSISTHDGGLVEAEPVDSSDEIMTRRRPDTQVLAVDEVQFLDDGIVDVANTLADQGVRIVLAGIDMDFRGLPFGPMPALLAIAEIVDKLQAICVVCGEPASRNQRLVNGRPALWDSPTIMVGGRESYAARCSPPSRSASGRTCSPPTARSIARRCARRSWATRPRSTPSTPSSTRRSSAAATIWRAKRASGATCWW